MENQLKITHNKLGYVSLVGWIVLFQHIFCRILGKNAKNRDKDWMWRVRMYSTYRMNTQILPRFSRIYSRNENSGWRLTMKNYDVSQITLSDLTLFVSNKRKNWKIKIWYGKIGNSQWRWYVGAKSIMNSQSLPCFSRTNSLKQRKLG